jgi:hypothetical protein
MASYGKMGDLSQKYSKKKPRRCEQDGVAEHKQ